MARCLQQWIRIGFEADSRKRRAAPVQLQPSAGGSASAGIRRENTKLRDDGFRGQLRARRRALFRRLRDGAARHTSQ